MSRCKAVITKRSWGNQTQQYQCYFDANDNGYCGTHDPMKRLHKLNCKVLRLRGQLNETLKQIEEIELP